MGRLDNKVAVITGAASGIGRATARRFAAEGASVVVADFDDVAGPAVATEIGGLFVQVNVADEGSVVAMYDKTAEVYGGIDILFNNAGISPADDDSILTTGLDAWKRVQDVNLTSVYLCCKYGIPHLQRRGGGSIINTASIAGLQAGWGPIAYSSAKAAVIQLSRAAAAQLSPNRIRVNAICPGLIATSIFGASMGLPREVADQMAARIADTGGVAQPIPRAGVPEDIAQAALYLASDAAGFVTGTHLVVDGGITVGSRHAWDPSAPSVFAAMFPEWAPPAE